MPPNVSIGRLQQRAEGERLYVFWDMCPGTSLCMILSLFQQIITSCVPQRALTSTTSENRQHKSYTRHSRHH